MFRTIQIFNREQMSTISRTPINRQQFFSLVVATGVQTEQLLQGLRPRPFTNTFRARIVWDWFAREHVVTSSCSAGLAEWDQHLHNVYMFHTQCLQGLSQNTVSCVQQNSAKCSSFFCVKTPCVGHSHRHVPFPGSLNQYSADPEPDFSSPFSESALSQHVHHVNPGPGASVSSALSLHTGRGWIHHIRLDPLWNCID
ncbi:hypothetical protein M758_1G196200 [Ceratodon purpureus]|nr:hypothetical protein M758_1G196200 [Ceratodon purpureus]